jgi:hypothetical protein
VPKRQPGFDKGIPIQLLGGDKLKKQMSPNFIKTNLNLTSSFKIKKIILFFPGLEKRFLAWVGVKVGVVDDCFLICFGMGVNGGSLMCYV